MNSLLLYKKWEIKRYVRKTWKLHENCYKSPTSEEKSSDNYNFPPSRANKEFTFLKFREYCNPLFSQLMIIRKFLIFNGYITKFQKF